MTHEFEGELAGQMEGEWVRLIEGACEDELSRLEREQIEHERETAEEVKV